MSHTDISMQTVQERRDQKLLPSGRGLHEYANLYFCARNPMMFARKELVDSTCVLRISINIFNQLGVYVSDGNASSAYTRFYNRDDWNGKLDYEIIFMDDWRAPDQYKFWGQKRQKCAEILVPDKVPPEYIIGAYVGTPAAHQALLAQGFRLDIQENKHIFFL